METVLYIVFVLVCAALILLILIQQGKGAGVGFSMGGASQAMFGGSGGLEFFIKVTAALAVAFMVICIVLAKMAVSDAGAYHGALAGAAEQAPASQGAEGLPGGAPLSSGAAPAAPGQAPLAPAQAASKPLQAVPMPVGRPGVPAAPVQAPAPAKH